MVLDYIANVFDSLFNALLIPFIRAFDFVFGFAWAEGDPTVWIAISALVLLLLFA